MNRKLEILKKHFNYDKFRDFQEEIIDNILANKDVVAVIKTGGGKSIIFQVAGLLLENIILVITPLISLMIDQVNNLNKNKIKACYINSNLDNLAILNIYNNINNYKFIYITPERLNSNIFNKFIKDISLIVIDEAHTILWGKDFRPAFLTIKNYINNLKKRPIIALFTATANKKDILYFIKTIGLDKPFISYNLPIKDNIKYLVVKNDFLLNLENILNKNKDHLTIIYTVSIKKCLYLYNYLKVKYDVLIYHSKLDKDIKINNQNLFTNEKIKIMIATNAFGMGIDIRNIKNVILYDIPLSLSDLLQQTGRAGRNNSKAYAYLFLNYESLKENIYFIRKSIYYKEYAYNLKKVINFIKSKDKNKYLKRFYNI